MVYRHFEEGLQGKLFVAVVLCTTQHIYVLFGYKNEVF